MDNNTDNNNKIKICNICSLKKYEINVKKPPLCWNYVLNNGYCIHNKYLLHEGKIINNEWHPGFEEIQQLKFKISKL